MLLTSSLLQTLGSALAIAVVFAGAVVMFLVYARGGRNKALTETQSDAIESATLEITRLNSFNQGLQTQINSLNDLIHERDKRIEALTMTVSVLEKQTNNRDLLLDIARYGVPLPEDQMRKHATNGSSRS